MALDKIERLIRAEEWLPAREAILASLAAEPNSHWLLTRLGLTYYECRDYSEALLYSERARALAPGCPLVLWDMAGTLQMLERHKEAVDIYRALIRKGAKKISADECGEGLARARGLVADCHYRLSDSLEALGLREQALAEFETHLDLRGPGCHSIYPIKDLNKPANKHRIRRLAGKK